MKADDEVDDGDSMAAYGEGDTGKKKKNIAFNAIFGLVSFVSFMSNGPLRKPK